MKHKVGIVESLTGREFVGIVEADSEEEAIKKAKEIFLKEYPAYSAHLIPYYWGPVLTY